MLTDAALRNLKPKSKIYKVSDRDGMYVTYQPAVPSPSAGLDFYRQLYRQLFLLAGDSHR